MWHIMKSFGICIGASTLSIVELFRDGKDEITTGHILRESHYGNPKKALFDTIQKLDIDGATAIAVTGRKFRHFVNLTSIPEPEAVEQAFFHVNGNGPHINAIVSAGGETFLVYVLGRDGRIASVQTGNKCASGTGEFFLQQIKRLGIPLSEAVTMARSSRPYRVSGRCSVFCKSDCTHATNKGIPRDRVTAGLCQMMAGKIMELTKQIPRRDMMLIGGCARNTVMTEYLKGDIENLSIPEEAPYFEALGCALWALGHETRPFPGPDRLFRENHRTFFHLPPLDTAAGMVEFRTGSTGTARAGDVCIIGLDVGSTTTKALLLRLADDSILASTYLRTEGDPVGASRACYGELLGALGDLEGDIPIIGLGVTGSGRQIAGLHAMTDGIINEIIAHATGALYFDGDVDTIFEIGGQDAKYTYITQGVPSDYAMNEACSAGTGSFLEEAALETLSIAMEDIADIALRGDNPPNFNDQCAAFISSDIKNALHEGMEEQDIVAGLVYSICMNYANRVKGNRPVGDTVFMQGGVCYNRAVPLAMASLTGKHIIVPPDPGLIGAFGVALEIKRRLSLGLMGERTFSLKALMNREIGYGSPFICNGGKEGCDRKCEIARIRIEGKTYPFGGACNRWYNLRSRKGVGTEGLNHVDRYEDRVFSPQARESARDAPTVGINRSFFVNTYFPLYHHFFSRCGFRVILPHTPEREGMDSKNAPFCYPAEISHGYFLNLLGQAPDYIFLPHFTGDFVEEGPGKGVTCPLSQGEPYYLSSTFKDHETLRDLEGRHRVLKPVIDFSGGLHGAEGAFAGMASRLGVTRRRAVRAYREAVEIQRGLFETMKEAGLRVLADLAGDPDAFSIVILGRPYNAFVSEGHMGIPKKIASRNIPVLPFSYLPLAGEPVKDHMYWSAGQQILKAARFIRRHPQLFGCYITNFSCGPDSFLVGYFRDIMADKPSLTLELDSHVADAGLETRIEAFIDIVERYRHLDRKGMATVARQPFRPARVIADRDRGQVIDSDGVAHSLFDPRVHLLFPSMGRLTSESGAAVFRGSGVRSTALPPADEETLKIGRGHTSCKECLPLLLTTGSLLRYVDEGQARDELVIYFMPTATGPCRYGQYSVFLQDLITRLRLRNVALFSLSAENSYAGLRGRHLTMRLWAGVVVADIFEEIRSFLLTAARDGETAMERFEAEWRRVIAWLERPGDFSNMAPFLEGVAQRLRGIDVKAPLEAVPRILLTGEIYVRHDDISRQYITEELADRGFAVKVSTLAEWVYYTAWCVRKGFSTGQYSARERFSVLVRTIFMRRHEGTMRDILSRSGLCTGRLEDVDHIIAHTSHLIDPHLVGEAILTAGATINDVLDHCCGVIAIGPFGCMPNRLAEAVVTGEMNREGKLRAGIENETIRSVADRLDNLPFLAIESDGNRFPQIITAKVEAFLLQAGRVHEEMQRVGLPDP